MLLLAIGKRIQQYGVTEDRYFLVALALWLSGIALFFIVRRNGDIRVIPATLCVLAPCAALSEEHGERRAIADTSARRLIENVPGKAAEARFVYEDIENFLEAYARA